MLSNLRHRALHTIAAVLWHTAEFLGDLTDELDRRDKEAK